MIASAARSDEGRPRKVRSAEFGVRNANSVGNDYSAFRIPIGSNPGRRGKFQGELRADLNVAVDANPSAVSFEARRTSARPKKTRTGSDRPARLLGSRDGHGDAAAGEHGAQYAFDPLSGLLRHSATVNAHQLDAAQFAGSR
jgi:hypothetical protein